MNQKLQQVSHSIRQPAHLSDDDTSVLAKTIQEVDKEPEITAFKLDRSEKVKKTTAILLEETIKELEQKRKAVEEANAALTTSPNELTAKPGVRSGLIKNKFSYTINNLLIKNV